MLSYEVEGLDKMAHNLRKLSSGALLLKAVSFALSKVAKELRTDVIPDTPRALGDLVNSWRVEKRSKDLIEVGYDIIYGAYQERGSRFDGSHKIENRPAGGKTGFLTKNIDDNLQKYYDIFEKEIMNYIEKQF